MRLAPKNLLTRKEITDSCTRKYIHSGHYRDELFLIYSSPSLTSHVKYSRTTIKKRELTFSFCGILDVGWQAIEHYKCKF